MNVVNHQTVNQKQTAYIGIYIVNDSKKNIYSIDLNMEIFLVT